MQSATTTELLESYFVELDPVIDGCLGVFVELYRQESFEGDIRFVLTETAAATGNVLLRLNTTSEARARAALAAELSSSCVASSDPDPAAGTAQ